MFNPLRSMSPSQRLTLGATALASAASATQAAIVYTDLSSNPLVVGTSQEVYVNFLGGTAGTSVPQSYDVSLRFGTDPQFNPNLEKPEVFSANSNNFVVGTGNQAARLSAGTPITGGSGFADQTTAYLEENDIGPWQGTSGEAFVGWKNTAANQDAWLRINYNDAANSYVLTGFAINDSGALTAGQTVIPEPASAAALAALLAGGVATFRRRRPAVLADAA